MSETGTSEAGVELEHASFRALFDSMPQLGWTARADGFIDFYNRGWYAYTGTTPKDMEGWGWTSVHDPVLLDGVMEHWRQSLATGQAFETEFPLRRHDGVFRWFLTRALPLRDTDGAIVRWVGINTDIDDVRAARELAGQSAEQSRGVERTIVELREAKERAERRVAELEEQLAAAHGEASGDA